jgi:hypothetical protein
VKAGRDFTCHPPKGNTSHSFTSNSVTVAGPIPFLLLVIPSPSKVKHHFLLFFGLPYSFALD